MKLRLALAASAALLAASFGFADVNLNGAKCPVVGHAANVETSVDYKGGKIYMCCAGCDVEFKENTAKYAAKANHQLFLTGQARQIACPLSGGPTSAEHSAKVAGAEVQFCCAHCAEQAQNAATDEEKLSLLFNDESFDKAFKVGD